MLIEDFYLGSKISKMKPLGFCGIDSRSVFIVMVIKLVGMDILDGADLSEPWCCKSSISTL